VRTIRYRGCKGEGQSSKPKQFFLEKQRIIKLQCLKLGKAQEKTVQRKLIIRLRRSTTLLELEGAFSAGTKGVSIATGVRTTSLFLFRAPFRFTIFHTTEIPFAHCCHKYLSNNLLVS
jgi:hypothetical protein